MWLIKYSINYAMTQMKLEEIMLSKISQSKRDKYCYDSTYMSYLEQANSQAQEEERWLLRAEGGQDGELLSNGYSFHLGRWRKFWTWVVVMVAQK